MAKTTKTNGPKATTTQHTTRRVTKTVQSVRRATAPIASASIVGPSQFTMQSVSDGVVRFRGHEILGWVQSPASGNVAAVYDLNPACWASSRLARIAATYEKYRYDQFTIRYHPYVSTTATGVIAAYVELEPDEDVAPDVTVAMNHQYAAMGPVWSGLELTYRRPTQDPRAYMLTDVGAGNRNDMSQGKIICVSFAPAALHGYFTIEYDVTFMYPELETGYPGQQFELSTASIAAAAANANIVANPVWNSSQIKVAEVVLNNVLTNVVNASGNVIELRTGSTLYTAWDGAAWMLYENLEQALALVNPLRTSVAIAAGVLNYWVRRLTKQ